MFGVGHLADRMHLRKFLTFGMLASAACVCAFGMAAFLEIHTLWYFLVIQIVGGEHSHHSRRVSSLVSEICRPPRSFHEVLML
jgi:sugar phosphate permease